MTVSIIIPVYNGSTLLPTTVESVLSQTYGKWELILVDDGSSDDSYVVAVGLTKRDERIQAFRKENGGVACARNYGFSKCGAASEFVTFLDQDDLWEAEFLETMVTILERHPGFSAIHALARQIDINGTPSGVPGGRIFHQNRRKVVDRKIVSCSELEPTGFDALVNDNWIPTPGVVLVRRSALEAAAKDGNTVFDPAMGTADDWDMWIRISMRGDIFYLPEVLLGWRIHESNNSGNIRKAYYSEFRVREKVTRIPCLSHEQRMNVVFRFRKAVCSAHLLRIFFFAKSIARYAPHGKFASALVSLIELMRSTASYTSLRLALNSSTTLPDVPDVVGTHRSWPPR
jgi:glycosyltransferase involved in cell wall biosynthesis